MISENKIKHCLGVARACRGLAISHNLPSDMVDAMFVMGLLHDIGYEQEPDSNHGNKSFEMIENFIKYQKEANEAIMCHGLVSTDMQWSIFDEILNQADMIIGHDGSHTTIADRLKGIRDHWGEDSIHYQHALNVVEKIKTTEKEKENGV